MFVDKLAGGIRLIAVGGGGGWLGFADGKYVGGDYMALDGFMGAGVGEFLVDLLGEDGGGFLCFEKVRLAAFFRPVSVAYFLPGLVFSVKGCGVEMPFGWNKKGHSELYLRGKQVGQFVCGRLRHDVSCLLGVLTEYLFGCF